MHSSYSHTKACTDSQTLAQSVMKRAIVITLLSIFIGYNLVDEFDSSSLVGKNVVITGASSGIGEQMAYHYASMGANLLLAARSENRLQNVIKRCEELGSDHTKGRYFYYAADLSDTTATEALLKKAEDRLGGIDYLVLNHIIPTFAGKWTGSKDNLTALHATIEVNFISYVTLASQALPLLQRSSGSIVVVSSVAGRISQPNFSPYCASKFALEGFFSTLRQELSMQGIDVSITLCIIGLVDTKNAVTNLQNLGATKLLSWIPLARSSDVALAIIKGGATRAREILYPYLEIKTSAILNNLSPKLMEKFVQFLLQ